MFHICHTLPQICNPTDTSAWQVNYDGLVGWVSAGAVRIDPDTQLVSIPIRT